MAMTSNNDSNLHQSAPTAAAATTPTRLGLEYLHFYSAPTSPIPTESFFTYDYYGEDDGYEDANNNFIDFEFETSRRFNPEEGYDFDRVLGREEEGFESPYQQQQQRSLPAMAFADELFCDGKVMPLKPPPPSPTPPPRRRLMRNVDCNSSSSPRPPTATAAAFKLPLPRRSLWNDDFDPFMVALENVKNDADDIQKRDKAKDHRRALSMSSPLRAATSTNSPRKSMSFRHPEINQSAGSDQNRQMESNGPYSIWVPYKNPVRSAEKGESSCTWLSKKQKIKKLLLKSTSMGMGRSGRRSNEVKQKEEREALPPKKEKSFGRNNEERRVSSQVTKITLMQYRPRLFVCMGSRAKYVM